MNSYHQHRYQLFEPVPHCVHTVSCNSLPRCQHYLAAAEAFTKLAADEQNKAAEQSARAQAQASEVIATSSSSEGDVFAYV